LKHLLHPIASQHLICKQRVAFFIVVFDAATKAYDKDRVGAKEQAYYRAQARKRRQKEKKKAKSTGDEIWAELEDMKEQQKQAWNKANPGHMCKHTKAYVLRSTTPREEETPEEENS